MFYHVAQNGFPTQFGSFESFFQMLVDSTEGVYEISGTRPNAPRTSDFHSVDHPAPLGFDNRPIKIWYRRGIFIGYEF